MDHVMKRQKGETKKAFIQRQTCHINKKLEELEAKAGIFEKLDKVRKSPTPYSSLPPLNDDLAKREEETHARDQVTAIKDAYLSVKDGRIRSLLISGYRKTEELGMQLRLEHLNEACAELTRRKNQPVFSVYETLIMPTGLMAGGYYALGLIGFIGGGVLWIIAMIADLDRKKRCRESFIADAEEDVKTFREIYTQCERLPYLFDR